jgi:hypothetical protein
MGGGGVKCERVETMFNQELTPIRPHPNFILFNPLHCYKKSIHAAGDHHWSRQNIRLVRTLSVCSSVYVCTSLFLYVCTCMSICTFVFCTSVCLPAFLPACIPASLNSCHAFPILCLSFLSVCLSVCLSVFLSLSMQSSFCTSVCFSACLHALLHCLSVCSSVYVCTSLFLYVCTCMTICTFVFLYIRLSACIPARLHSCPPAFLPCLSHPFCPLSALLPY